MYKCGLCHKNSTQGERAAHVITESRTKTYVNDEGKTVGTGWEIVKEVKAHPECADKFLWEQEALYGGNA